MRKEYEETFALQKFEGSIRTVLEHLELVNSSLILAENQLMSAKGKVEIENIAEALNSTTRRYPRLKMPCSQTNIRRLVLTSRKKIHEQAVIELYRLFSNYIKNLIEDFVHVNPQPLLMSIASNKKENIVSFDDILKIGNYDGIITRMADIIYRRFENERSTPKLLDKILSYAHIEGVDDQKQNALLYLEIRHLIIHNNSKADENFKNRDIAGKVALNRDSKIRIDYALVVSAINAVSNLCKVIDKELVTKNMVRKRFI